MTEPPVIALVDWSHLLEDFLDPIGVPFEAFCTEMTGGWMFGYLDALRHAGCRPVLFCVSARVTDVTRSEHVPTGATICVLPAPAGYRRVRMRVPNPYAVDLAAAAGDLQGPRRLWTAFLKEVSPYLATPLRTLARELRRERCCVILCQEYEHARFDACVLLGRLAGLPVYATFQGGNWQLSRFERPLRPVALRACAGLIVASSVEAERLRRCYNVPAGKIAPIFNPIDLRLWPPVARHEREEARAALGIPPGARVVAWHGRVEIHRKGLDLLVAAWEAIRRTRAGRLLLVGTGRDAPALRALLANGAGIHWIDEYVTDRALLRRHLAAADVYAFPSRNEGFPMAPVEAMACGLPVVGADAPGVADILGAGPDAAGTVVPVGDAESLAQALGRLLDDEELSVALGARARRRVEERFSRESVGRELRTFLTRGEERR